MLDKIWNVSILIALVLIGAAVGVEIAPSMPKPKLPVETIYLVNHAPAYISDKAIKRDIPAWEQAANGSFSRYWHSPQVKLELAQKVPVGSVSAVFEKEGPIQGALAYHNVRRGFPQIIVYAGVGKFYGYSNSVSFTHELFEMLADHAINSWSWHWQSQYPDFYIGAHVYKLPRGALWFNEVCDPVEAYSYRINGVAISDYVTPNWFDAQTNGAYDGMGLIHEPFNVLRGGYAQFVANGLYHEIQDFRHAGRDAAGFQKAEGLQTKGLEER